MTLDECLTQLEADNPGADITLTKEDDNPAIGSLGLVRADGRMVRVAVAEPMDAGAFNLLSINVASFLNGGTP